MGVLFSVSAGVGLISGAAVIGVLRRLIGALSRRVVALVSLTVLALDVAVGTRLFAVHLTWAVPAFLYFTAVAVALSVVDIDRHRLPNLIVLPSYPILAALLAIAAAGTGDWAALRRAAIGGAALFAGYFLMALIYPPGLGFGDVKLAGLVGTLLAYLSWSALLIGTFAGYLGGGLAGIGLILSRRGTRHSTLPFGPFMLGGVFLALFWLSPMLARLASEV
jgi:leader peptidase (prepilin peptidase)/N-methyltransferase